MKVVQVTNICLQATVEQISTLFSFLGSIEDIKLYPESQGLSAGDLKCAFVKFKNENDAGVALHLNNTVFIDRALVLAPHDTDDLPDETEGLRINSLAPRVESETRFPRWPPNVVNQIVGAGPGAVIHTHDPKFSVLNLPPYPTLPASTDPSKIDEIRRTLYAGNLDAFVTAEQLMQFFTQAGEIMYVRMAGDQTQPTRFAFIEFSHQSSIAAALSFNGMMFMGRALKVNHSNIAIIKPQQHALAVAPKNIDDVMRRVKEADKLISMAIDQPSSTNSGASVYQRKLFGLSGDSKRRSRSPSSRRRRSRSRSRGRRRRSRSRSKRRSRSKTRKSRSPRKRSQSRGRSKRSRSKEKEKRRDSRRSRSRDRKKRSRSRRKSTDRSRRSRSRKRSRSRRRSRSKDKAKDRSHRSRSRDRKKRSRHSRSRSPHKSSSSSSKRDRSRDRRRDRKDDRKEDKRDERKEDRRDDRKKDRKEDRKDDRKDEKDERKEERAEKLEKDQSEEKTERQNEEHSEDVGDERKEEPEDRVNNGADESKEEKMDVTDEEPSSAADEAPAEERAATPEGNGATSTSPSERAGSTPPLDRAEADLMNAVISSGLN